MRKRSKQFPLSYREGIPRQGGCKMPERDLPKVAFEPNFRTCPHSSGSSKRFRFTPVKGYEAFVLCTDANEGGTAFSCALLTTVGRAFFLSDNLTIIHKK